MQAEIDIDAPAAVVWTLISDLARTGPFSPECLGGNWNHDDETGGSRRAVHMWQPVGPARMDDDVDRDPSGNRNVRSVGSWVTYATRQRSGGTKCICARAAAPGKEEFVIAARTAEHRHNMELTLQVIRKAAEEHHES